MKRSGFLLLFCFLSMISLTAQGNLKIEPGANMVVNDSLHIVLDNTSFEVNGSFSPSNSSLTLTGNGTSSESSIKGNNSPYFHRLIINRGTDSSRLETNISVSEKVVLFSGKLDLHGNDLDLGITGVIEGETNNSNITSSSGGEIIATSDLIVPLNENPGNLGAFITSTAILGTTEIRRGHIAQSFSGGNGIQRYFQITPATNTSLDATLRFMYFDSELNGLNESDLELFKSIDSGMTWTNEGFTSKDIGDNYIELTGINSFSRWSATTMNTFPVGWLGFHAFPEKSAVRCEWITGFEQNTHYFQVEKSANGIDFEPIGKVRASGTSSEELTYQFTDRNPHKGKSWYQIRQIDLDGSFSLSQVEEIIFSGKEISIYPNPAREFINISLPETGHSRIELINLLGQIIAYWKEEKTNIQLNTEPFTKGVYLIKIYQNGNIYPQKIRIH